MLRETGAISFVFRVNAGSEVSFGIFIYLLRVVRVRRVYDAVEVGMGWLEESKSTNQFRRWSS